MNASFLKATRSLLLAALTICGSLHAETTSLTVSGLRNFGSESAPQARVDTLTVTLDPATSVLHGKPGQTIGWGFNLTWTSNAGDSISFVGSKLSGDLGTISSTGYKDIIGRLRGSTENRVPAGSTWQAAFAPGTSGVGSLTLNPDAVPGTTHEGELRLTFEVTDRTGIEPRALKNVVFTMNVTVVVDEPDPVEPADQTITFAEIPSHSIAEGSFTLSATASSNLPVRLRSLQPDICTVEGNTVTIHSAGTCSIIADQHGNYAYRPAPPVTHTFEVEKVPATVTLIGSLDRNYTGADQTFTATTVPPGLPVEFRYNGDNILPRDTGIYLVQAFIDDPAYSGTDAATLTITDVAPPPHTNYAGWLQSHFTPAQIQAGDAANNADPDGDGLANLIEYGFGLDPTSGSSASLPLAQLDAAGAYSVTFSQPAAVNEITYGMEWSPDLTPGSWTAVPDTGSGGVHTFTVPPGSPRVFLRFQTILSLPPGPAAAHVYEFNGTFNDSMGGPAMTAAGTVGATSYTFAAGQGPNVSNVLTNTGEYSIEMVFRFDQVSGFRSILNFNARASDYAFYCFGGLPYFYNYAGNATTPSLIANQMHRVIVTRNASTKLTTAYVDGVKTSEVTDTNNYYVATGTNGILHFFRDNGGENSAGTVDLIRIYDAVLTPAEVTALGAP